ncbi:DUF3570 domain-containing protein [Permianibacter fluminis]|uniref:DUF3570 domain-containing protein n=1 Tax=Permianibacter fluminis TaxID=2738515 RepID=UPI001B7D8014|nr:DUF3570 domain-containing protein [Permianibacter fluminis]
MAVAATKFKGFSRATLISVAQSLALLAGLACLPALGSVLPEERTDLMYHSYQGGGMDITGPSLLVRKNFLEKLSVSANYYVDNVSSASVDVQFISGASRYSEQRKEQSIGVDYLNNKTTMSMGYTTSKESDYDATTAFFGVSQDFFGDLTSISLGYSQGNDEVSQNNYTGHVITSTTHKGDVNRQNYRLNLSQILTKNFVMNLGFETISDEGFLNNPYRQVRYLNDDGINFTLQNEKYPETRTSDTVALRGIYYLPWRASIRGEYRYFTDTWGIEATSVEVRYVHPWDDNWLFEFKVRQYDQTKADFYSDLFPRESAFNFLARDKEMSTYTSRSIGIGASYSFTGFSLGPFEQFKLNLYVDHFEFDYDDFRDVPGGKGLNAGTEPLYAFSADVARLFLTVTY